MGTNSTNRCPRPEVRLLPRLPLLLLLVAAVPTPASPQPTTAGPAVPNLRHVCGDDGTEAVAQFWRTHNGAVYTQAVFGSLSTIACLTVLTVSCAYGKDRRSFQARIIAGLFVSNLVFSVGLAIPDGVAVCRAGQRTPITGGHLPATSLIYSAKWWMIAYELFIVATSVLTLHAGTTNLSRHREILGHAVCFVFGLTIFLVFFLKGGALVRAHEWASYGALEKHLMDGWATLFALFMILWIGLRLQLRKLTKEWGAAAADTKEEWQHDDRWIEPDTAVLEARDRKQQLLDLQKQSYQEVVLPLSPYVWTFLAFSIPAIAMATEACNAQSHRVHAAMSGPELSCYDGCYAALALRPLATAVVYFWDPQCRAELQNYRALGRKLWRRLSGFAAWTCGKEDRRRGLRFNRELEEVRIIDADAESDSDSEAVDRGDASGASLRYELMED